MDEVNKVSGAGKSGGDKKKSHHIPLIVVGVLLAAYLGLCAWVGASDRIMPNITAVGLDVSNMTVDEAAQALEQAGEGHSSQLAVELTCRSWSGRITAQQMNMDWHLAAEKALEKDRGHFLTNGFWYVAHLVGYRSEVTAPRQESQVLNGLLLDAAQHVNQPMVQPGYRVEGNNLMVRKGINGLTAQPDQVGETVWQAFDELFRQKLGAGAQGELSAQVEIPVEQTLCNELDYEAVAAAIHTEPKSAQMDPETLKVTDHVVGLDINVDKLQTDYSDAEEGTEFALPLNVTMPEETRQTLEGKLFRDVLGKSTSQVRGTANRISNVRLSARTCSGKILMPGEVFSYNKMTGSRSAAQGYLPAPVYSGGESVDGIGGGVCQTSSTIYHAVLHSTLEVVERRNHSFAVGYVPDGMDATAYYNTIDFKFKNNTNYPVKLVLECYKKNGHHYLTVTLLGTNETGRYAVPTNQVFGWQEPTTTYVPDDTVPRGTTVLDRKQNAYKGRKASVTRTIYEKDGTVVEKQDMGVSHYKMRPNMVHYNPLDGNPATWVNGQPPKPVTPEKPVVPVNPENPVTPEKPIVPVTPEKPVVPVTPEKPVVPVTPEKPVVPENPVTPEKPIVPVVPEKPVIPENPAIPEKPAIPEIPDTPAI